MMTRGVRRLAWSALVVLSVVAPASTRAQSQSTPPRTEQQLLEAIRADPSAVGAYLDLVKMYVEQRRFDEAKSMVARVLRVIDEQRASIAPAASAPTQPQRVGRNIEPPRLIKRVEAQYPDEARTAGIQGVVYLEVTVGADGRVADVQVLRSPSELLSTAAMKAVGQWMYQPTLLNGVAVPVIMTVTVNFKL